MGAVKTLEYTVISFHLSFKVWTLETFPEDLRALRNNGLHCLNPLRFSKQITSSYTHVLGADHNTSQDNKIDKLVGVVNHLATTIEQFTKKIDKWKNERQFGVNDIDNVEDREVFIDCC
ncbi:unnamed protein product [Lactuca saligna]|uniref:Uncharacterized protein n=1 Tax=Lactuca saligna TaxID=75948 RepID=A0AA35Y1W6_LACSI|nr:unnamed protein product [Lactuca saligna]